MAIRDEQDLVRGLREGMISRRAFLVSALALGMSASGIAAVLVEVSTAPAAAASYDLLASSSSNRSNPTPLAGRTVADTIYAFTSPSSGVVRVRFYLDDPTMSGTPRKVENTAPHDFAGGTVETGNPFDTATLSNGSHTIIAAVDLTAGGTEVVSSTFTVANPVTVADQIHLAWVGDPSTTLTVVWRVKNSTTSSTVEYRARGGSVWSSKTGAVRASGTTGSLRQVDLDGLTPATAYEYRVRGDGGVWSAVYTTRTAPPPGPADFDVVYFADTGLAGRSDGLATGTSQVVAEIAKLNPLLLLPGGDYAYFNTDKRYGTLENSIDSWFNQVQSIAAKSPMMPTYGNHEVLLGEGYQNWANRFPTPQGYDYRRNYSFDIGDVHFVSIHAVENYTALPAAQLSWIEQDISAAKAAGKRWIVPYTHVSAFADGKNHPSNLELRRQLGPLFQRYGVKLVLSSHDQAYERTYPLTDVPATNTRTSESLDCYTPSDGTTWVKISPGGKLSNISLGFSPFATTPAPAWTAYRNNTVHVFSRISFTAAGAMTVATYGVKGDGTPPTIIDTFRYDLNGCGPADTTPPTVVGTAPTPGATGVPATANVTATFSEAVNGATLTTSTFTLVRQGTTTVLGAAVSYDAATRRATLNPSADLAPGTPYMATVKGGASGVKDPAGNPLAADRVWSFTTAPAPTAGGLKGEYFDNQDLTNLTLTRTDPTVNFNWATGSPDPVVGADSFSVRWTGKVKADHSETYTFYTSSNDGVRLWVNGQLIVNNWTNHAVTENMGTKALSAGQWYPIKLEYYEGTGSAVVSLSYSSLSVSKRIIPSTNLSPVTP